ncbi:hypothetical protein E4K10_45740 [Streptomyces sp. T1317-0309]|nr:hypothetical protein E4K10_45740 [Streptomyces sp. T1317-0309]
MNATLVTAFGLISGAAGAGSRVRLQVAGRAQRGGNAVNGFNSFTDHLQEERKSSRPRVAILKAESAAERAEAARLRLRVQQLGGSP